VQYFTHLPVLLVGAHMLGATLVWIGVLTVLWSLRTRPTLEVAEAALRTRVHAADPLGSSLPSSPPAPVESVTEPGDAPRSSLPTR
jgi:cytochrome c oxidase assembly protein subunit 15